MGLKEKQSSGVVGGKPWATRSGSKSGRPIAGAVQGSATAVSGRVPHLSDTKLDCGRLSVESKKRQGLVEVQPTPDVQEFPFGFVIFATGGRAAITANYPHGTALRASRGRTATAVEGRPQRSATMAGGTSRH